ncbi:MAG TPA: DNA polymerase I [Candidatus Saccharimonadales bacterium]|nr:DNA polymerase I [Candidatus Saccharimonadales bacterium]
MAKRERLVLIDGSAVFHRGYHGIPPLSTAEGIPTNATYGFTMMLLKVLADLKPKYTIITWDKSSDTFRKDMYPQYKAHRKKQPDDLYAQIPYTRQVTESLGLPWIELDKYEADDIIGTLARKAEKEGLETIIVTGDKDEFQLIDENTRVYTMRRGFTDTVIYDLEALRERYGVTPRQFVDVKALMGDSSDNIPGVEGVGEKTATSLVQQYGSLEGIYESVDEIPGKLGERLRDNKDIAYLSHKLSEIACDAPVELDLKGATVGKFDRQAIHDLFRKLEFKTLLAKLPPEMEVGPLTLFDKPDEEASEVAKRSRKHLEGAEYHAITTENQLDDLVKRLKSAEAFAFDTETDSIDEMSANLVGISVSMKEMEGFYIPVGHREGTQLSKEAVCQALKAVFEDPKVGKVGHNAKFDYKVLVRHGIAPSPIIFDTMIAAFIVNPLGRSQSLDDLAYKEFGIELIPITELLGVGKKQITFDGVPIEEAITYAAEDADIAWRLYQSLKKQMSETGFNKLAEATEWPLIEVLGNMEIAGIELDVEFLRKFNEVISTDIAKLEQQIWKAAGEEFNISSPAQLAKILYEKLDLQKVGVKKGKTGFSTAASELEKLRDAHPIINLISEYRELTKLRSTYVEALPQYVDENSRVHTSFNQTIAQTGRLNSTNPNLQNIPVRTEIGRQIRKAFVAPKGRVLVSADYSQIELRVAAALSKDQGMIETFKKGIDLHQQTASEMFGVPLNEVTKEQRYSAKTINFGVLYGMSPHGLSVATGMNREEATGFIDRYFEVRKDLRAYIENVKKFARENEYTETLLGRRRPCPEIKSSNFVIRNSTERIAVNVPIQGTAADIMKIAMIEVAKKLEGSNAKMLLQVHDQLILEADEKDADRVTKLLKDTMENVYDLGVPLVADTSIGKNWGEL